ncbi:MAG: M56 family metallopeptidase [Clostridiales bacterium]|nr:M56 family metallopeptidase [Clostridiales bacterium]
MLGSMCYWIFNMSIVASFMGLLVLLIRRIRSIPRRVLVFLWAIPFLRMCFPLGINSKYSLMSLISRFTMRTVTVYHPTDDISMSFSNVLRQADSYSPVTFKDVLQRNVFGIAGLIWLIGAISILLVLITLYVATMREIRDASLLSGNVYLSSKVGSPAVYGILRPRIILPESYADHDLKYILRHEQTHIRRVDNLWRLLGFLAAAIHWFNPLTWVFLKAFLSDLELACDESAVAAYSAEERKDYATALLDSAKSRSLFVSAFGGAKVRTRIENVLSYKKMTAISTAGFTILILAIMYTLLTNAG